MLSLSLFQPTVDPSIPAGSGLGFQVEDEVTSDIRASFGVHDGRGGNLFDSAENLSEGQLLVRGRVTVDATATALFDVAEFSSWYRLPGATTSESTGLSASVSRNVFRGVTAFARGSERWMPDERQSFVNAGLSHHSANGRSSLGLALRSSDDYRWVGLEARKERHFFRQLTVAARTRVEVQPREFSSSDVGMSVGLSAELKF